MWTQQRSAKVNVIEILLQLWASDGRVLIVQSHICRWLTVSMGIVQWTKELSRSKKLIWFQDFGVRWVIWKELRSGKGSEMWILESRQSVYVRNFTMMPSARTFHNLCAN